MIWLGIASLGLALVTISGVFPLPKALITLEFFGGLGLIFWGCSRRQERRNDSQQES